MTFTLFLNNLEFYTSFFQISPVGLIILSVVSFRWCRFSEMFDWSTHSGYLYLPSWVREIGAMMQLLPLLLVPFVGVIQSCRYFLNGQGPLHERINLLYRPSYEAYTNRWVKFMEEISIKSSLSYRTWHAGLYSIDYKLNWNLILRNLTKCSFNNGTKLTILFILTFEKTKIKVYHYFPSKITIINEDKELEDLIVVFMGNLSL